MGGDTGGDDYAEHRQLQHDRHGLRRPLIQEPGNMVGPTIQGVDALIAKDP